MPNDSSVPAIKGRAGALCSEASGSLSFSVSLSLHSSVLLLPWSDVRDEFPAHNLFLCPCSSVVGAAHNSEAGKGKVYLLDTALVIFHLMGSFLLSYHYNSSRAPFVRTMCCIDI